MRVETSAAFAARDHGMGRKQHGPHAEYNHGMCWGNRSGRDLVRVERKRRIGPAASSWSRDTRARTRR